VEAVCADFENFVAPVEKPTNPESIFVRAFHLGQPSINYPVPNAENKHKRDKKHKGK
jgi:hypothetical protein